MRVCSAALVLTASAAVAQDAVTLAAASQWLLNPGAEHSPVVATGELLGPGQFRLGLHTHLLLSPTLQLREHLVVAWAPIDRLQLLAQVPAVLVQRPAPLPELGIGRPWVGARVGVLAPQWGDALFLAAEANVGIPGLEQAELATRTLVPSGLLKVSAGLPISAGVVGVEVSGRASSGLVLLGGGVTVAAQGVHLGGELTARADLSLLGALRGFVEVLVGARYRLRPIELSLLGGPGYGLDGTSLTGRIVFGLAFVNPTEEAEGAPPLARPDCTEGTRYRIEACPTLDWDNDGLNNGVDQCPQDFGPKENGGCPWGDRDDDSVIDQLDNCPTVPGPASNAGCPSSRPQKVVIRQERLEVLEKIFFEFNQAVIKPESFALLEQVAAVLVAHPEIAYLRIEGHTDHVGSAEYNRGLSLARARAVKTFLIDHQVSGERMSARGYGFDRPIASNDDEEGRAKNRRVEFVIMRTPESGDGD